MGTLQNGQNLQPIFALQLWTKQEPKRSPSVLIDAALVPGLPQALEVWSP